jgi:hypothetical protein
MDRLKTGLLVLVFVSSITVTLADSIGESGYIVDWKQTRLRIAGSSQLVSQDSGNVIDWQLEAARNAEQNLLRSFIDAMKDIRIDGYHTAHDVLYQDLQRNEQIYSYFNSIRNRSISYGETDVVVEKELDFFGPRGFIPILFKAGKETGKFPEYCDYVFSTTFSGLLIDARGLDRKPAVAPSIYDQEHNLVYSADLMELYHFEERGAVLYLTDPNDKRIRERVGDNPFRTIAIPDGKLLETDLSIFSEDARVLLQNQATINNLQMGRVVIIVDSVE